MKTEDFTKTLKSRDLENETFFLQLKKNSRSTLWQKNILIVEVIFNSNPANILGHKRIVPIYISELLNTVFFSICIVVVS